MRWWAGCLLVGVVTALTTQAVYRTGLTVGPGIYVVWPVNGVALGLLVLVGWRCWPGLAAALVLTALLVPARSDENAWTPVQLLSELAVDVTLITLTAYFVRRIVGDQAFFGSLRQALALIAVAGIAGPALNTAGSIGALIATGLIDPDDGLLGLVLTWFASELLGAMIFAPALVIWSQHSVWASVGEARRGWAVGIVALAAACALAFSPLETWISQRFGLGDTVAHLSAFVVVLPTLTWLVVRFAQIGATLGMATLGVAATVGTASGHGVVSELLIDTASFEPVANTWLDPLTLAVVELQVVLACVGGTALLAGAIVAERGAQRDRLIAQSQALAEQSERQRVLGQRMLDTERRERVALAEQLHDGLIQSLAVGRLALGADDDATADRRLVHARQALQDAERQARDVLRELDPPALHILGLHGALAGLVRTLEERHDLPVLYDGQPPDRRPSPEIEAFLFRATRELLLNVVKHGGDRAKLNYHSDEHAATVRVWDDGPGFDLDAALQTPREDPNHAHYGLPSVAAQARAVGGELRVNPNTHTALEVTIPT